MDRRQILAAGLAAFGVPFVPRSSTAPSLTSVDGMLAAARRQYDAGRLDDLAAGLPEVIDAAEAHAAAAGGNWGPAALVRLAQVHALAASVEIKLGRFDVARAAADRASLAADRSSDPLARAVAARQASIVARKLGRPNDTIAIAIEAADRLQGAGLITRDHIAAHGELLLSAAYASACSGDRAQAEDLLAAAEAAARPLGDQGHGELGPANIASFRISAAFALGDAGTAVAIGQALPVALIPTAERAQRIFIDVARAYRQWSRPVDAFSWLLRAERAAPQAVRVRPVTRSLAHWLLGCPSTPGLSGVREFGLRVGAA